MKLLVNTWYSETDLLLILHLEQKIENYQIKFWLSNSSLTNSLLVFIRYFIQMNRYGGSLYFFF